MTVPGRYHWREEITIATVTRGRDPLDPLAGDVLIITPDPNRTNLPAAVQSLDRKAVIDAQLDTTREHWWIRFVNPGGEITRAGNYVQWRGHNLIPVSINPGIPIPGDDVEVICALASDLEPPPKQGN